MSTILSREASINIRETVPGDYAVLHDIRMSVKENVLPDPFLITASDYTCFMSVKGKGWLAVFNGKPAGFAIIDCEGQNIWALFVHPGFEKTGIGRKLHDTMLNWYFSHYDKELWLGTSPNTRAERFYRIAGWKENGIHKGREIRFVMSSDDWKNIKLNLAANKD